MNAPDSSGPVIPGQVAPWEIPVGLRLPPELAASWEALKKHFGYTDSELASQAAIYAMFIVTKGVTRFGDSLVDTLISQQASLDVLRARAQQAIQSAEQSTAFATAVLHQLMHAQSSFPKVEAPGLSKG